jgi:glucoamylase
VTHPVKHAFEVWTQRHRVRHFARGKILRLIVTAQATVVWSADGWRKTNRSEARPVERLDLWFADLPTKDLPPGATVDFTYFWKATQTWEGKNYSVSIEV